MTNIRIYTDGSCSGNPGNGGWACIINTEDDIVTLCGGERNTTNNKMELVAAIRALAYIKDKKNSKEYAYEIYSDSAYVVNAIDKKWLDNWKANGWKTKSGDGVKNVELWKEMSYFLEKLSDISIKFIKVKGHSGNTFNELADKTAKQEAIRMANKKS